MLAYIVRRLALIVPTLFGIMVINFIVIQAAPGGPIEQLIATFEGTAVDLTARVSGTGPGELLEQGGRGSGAGNGVPSKYRGAQGLDPELIEALERQFGFDRPAHERFFRMLWAYLRFDFGESFFQDRAVVDLVLEKMPVSISLGLWTTLLVYLISIPLGIAKAVRDGSRFDVWSSGVVIVGNAIPGFLFAILLIVLFAGGRYLHWFPLRGLTSPGWEEMTLLARDRGLSVAYRPAGPVHGDRGVRRPHPADQELLSGGDQQAVRRDRPAPRGCPSAGCSTATSSATPC